MRPPTKPVIAVIDLAKGTAIDELLRQRFPEGPPRGAYILVFDGPNAVATWQAGSVDEAGEIARLRDFEPEWCL